MKAMTNETLVRVWVADQPEGLGYDGTDYYLRAANVAYEDRDGMLLMPWPEFVAGRAAVAKVGHGKDDEGQPIPGSPDLVACQPYAEGATEAVQQMDSRNGIEPKSSDPILATPAEIAECLPEAEGGVC